MSYGQHGQSNQPWQSQPAVGFPTYPAPPQHAPALHGAQQSQHPGWLARSLFWAALVIGALPALVLMPVSVTGGRETMVLYSIGTVVTALLRLILGAVAIGLVKNTSWTRIITGAAVFVLGCLVLLVLSPLLSMFLGMSGAGPGGSVQSMTIVQAILSTVYLAGVFCGWNIVRNRRWWILLIGVVAAVVMNVLNSFLGLALAASSVSGVIVTVGIQAAWLALTFAVLGLFHLLGRIRGATIQTTRPGTSPQQGYQSPGYPIPPTGYPIPQSGYPAQPHLNQDPNDLGNRRPY